METHLASRRVHGHGPGTDANSVSIATHSLSPGIGLAAGDLDPPRSHLPEPVLHGARGPPLGRFCTVQDRSGVPAPDGSGAPPSGSVLHGARSARRPGLARCKRADPGTVLHGARPRFRIASGRPWVWFARCKTGPANQLWTTQKRRFWVCFAPCKMAALGSVLHGARPASRSRFAPEVDARRAVLPGGRPQRIGAGGMSAASGTCSSIAPGSVLHRARSACSGRHWAAPGRCTVQRALSGPARSCTVQDRSSGSDLHGVVEDQGVSLAPCKTSPKARSCTVQNGDARVGLAPCKNGPASGSCTVQNRPRGGPRARSCTVQNRPAEPRSCRCKTASMSGSCTVQSGPPEPGLHRGRASERILHRAKWTRGQARGPAPSGRTRGSILHRAKPTWSVRLARCKTAVPRRSCTVQKGPARGRLRAGRRGRRGRRCSRTIGSRSPTTRTSRAGASRAMGAGPGGGRFARCKSAVPGSILHGARPAGFASRFR